MLKWLLLLGFLLYAGDYLLSSSNSDLKTNAILKRNARSELEALASACTEDSASRGELPERLGSWAGGNLVDPWGNPYRYRRLEARRAEIRSLGADGVEGGVGLDADLVVAIRAK